MLSAMELFSSEADICQSRAKGKGPLCDFIRAAKAVRVVNQKLSSFERGFISEGGIKDREWYKHLGVAPGKHTGKSFFGSYLIIRKVNCVYTGYAPTTLPGLTEAILFDEDYELAKHEAARLTTLIEILADSL